MNESKKTDMVKAVAGFMVAPALGRLVSGIVATNVPKRTRTEKVLVFYGQFLIVSILSDVARKHTDQKIDELVTMYRTLTEKE